MGELVNELIRPINLFIRAAFFEHLIYARPMLDARRATVRLGREGLDSDEAGGGGRGGAGFATRGAADRHLP